MKNDHQKNQPSTSKLSAKEKILHTAHDLFYADGIRATGVDRLIKESNVTKVTFYRHFPSKNDLIIAFLHYRHQRWMNWFSESLQQQDNIFEALQLALTEWFTDSDYRGCAFINSVSELGKELPEVAKISLEHKQEMTDLIASRIENHYHAKEIAEAISLAIDGAITRSQGGEPIAKVLEAFNFILTSLEKIEPK